MEARITRRAACMPEIPYLYAHDDIQVANGSPASSLEPRMGRIHKIFALYCVIDPWIGRRCEGDDAIRRDRNRIGPHYRNGADHS